MSTQETEETVVPAGVEDFEIEQLDGAKALLRLGSEVRLVDQADLHRVSKAVAAAIQHTY